jgi:hypothetical protein
LLIGASLFYVPEFMSRYHNPTKFYRYLRTGAWWPTRLIRRYLTEARICKFQLEMRPVMAFKAMYNQIRPPWLMSFLRERKNLRILHLRRDNLLKSYVSKQLLGRKRRHSTEPLAPMRIAVSASGAIKYMRHMVAEYDRHERLFADHERLALCYETMIEGPGLAPQVARDICRFLGVPEHPMQSKLVKVNPERLQDFVENYDELARAVANSEFAAMLD